MEITSVSITNVKIAFKYGFGREAVHITGSIHGIFSTAKHELSHGMPGFRWFHISQDNHPGGIEKQYFLGIMVKLYVLNLME